MRGCGEGRSGWSEVGVVGIRVCGGWGGVSRGVMCQCVFECYSTLRVLAVCVLGFYDVRERLDAFSEFLQRGTVKMESRDIAEVIAKLLSANK